MMVEPTTFELRSAEGYSPDVVVLAQGEYPTHPQLLDLLERVPHLVVCDGAIRGLWARTTRRPDCVIGDGDSVPMDELKDKGIDFVHVSDQETNDLTKGVNYCLSKGWSHICILGATGRREDHTIGNIMLLPEYLRMGAEVRMLSDYGMFVPLIGCAMLYTEVGRQLSFFNVGGQPFTVTGVKYPIDHQTFSALWQATLNEATSPTVSVTCSDVVLVYMSEEIKAPH